MLSVSKGAQQREPGDGSSATGLPSTMVMVPKSPGTMSSAKRRSRAERMVSSATRETLSAADEAGLGWRSAQVRTCLPVTSSSMSSQFRTIAGEKSWDVPAECTLSPRDVAWLRLSICCARASLFVRAGSFVVGTSSSMSSANGSAAWRKTWAMSPPQTAAPSSPGVNRNDRWGPRGASSASAGSARIMSSLSAKDPVLRAVR